MKSNIWVNDGPCPRDQLKSSDWTGIALYDDAIVFKIGDSLLILDDKGFHVDAQDVVLNSPEPILLNEEPPTS